MGNETANPAGEFEYEDGDSWHGKKDGLGIKELSLNCYNKAMREGSKEMTEGGVFSRFINGELIEMIAPNQREIFINSVKMAHITIMPYIDALNEKKTQDKKIKKMFDDVKETLKNIDKIYEKKREVVDKNTANRTGTVDMKTRAALINEYNDGLTQIQKEREITIVSAYYDLLSAISFLLNNLGYFEETGVIGTA